MPDTLREKIAEALYERDLFNLNQIQDRQGAPRTSTLWEDLDAPRRDEYLDLADAVMTLLREHLGSDEVVERAAKALYYDERSRVSDGILPLWPERFDSPDNEAAYLYRDNVRLVTASITEEA